MFKTFVSLSFDEMELMYVSEVFQIQNWIPFPVYLSGRSPAYRKAWWETTSATYFLFGDYQLANAHRAGLGFSSGLSWRGSILPECWKSFHHASSSWVQVQTCKYICRQESGEARESRIYPREVIPGQVGLVVSKYVSFSVCVWSWLLWGEAVFDSRVEVGRRQYTGG